MSVIITCQSLSKSYSARPLFKDISFTVDDKDRLGLIGPNGSGKSTLLKIISGLVHEDDGEVSARRFLKTAYLAQENHFPENASLQEVVSESLNASSDSEAEHTVDVILSKVGFTDLTVKANALSGGWRKRLALACELVKQPDLLLLDEPTNHLDLEGVLWLEALLKSASFAFIVVSHDRSFLENITNRTIELNALYKDGYLSAKGPYSQFLVQRQEYVTAQNNEQQSLESQVRREVAWLQRGARARQTKSQARIAAAGRLIEDLQEVKSRNSASSAAADIDFNASGRRTKELVVCKSISKSLGGKLLFTNLDLTLTPGQKLGLLGTNGSGKTTLLKILAGKLDPDHGTIKRADNLKIVWFDQNREQLDKKITLREALCPNGDSVSYRGRSIHIASWAKRFLFRPDQLNLPVSYLSGGEQSRILIANLMLKEADILVLDEPTNDLDIPSLDVLEESLADFAGAIVLVTHDRYMLDTISNQILALDGSGGCKYFADYTQWESRKGQSGKKDKAAAQAANKASQTGADDTTTKPGKKPLSTFEKKELDTIGEKIAAAEAAVTNIKQRLEDPKLASNHVKLQEVMDELAQAENEVSKIYARWEDLELRKEMVAQ
jgi:ATP-binding cassette subfamily F protein uup